MTTRLEVWPFKLDAGDGIVGYMLQVWQPSFEDIDALKASGWQPNPPFAAAQRNLKNTVLFFTGDPDVALSGGITARQWVEAINIIDVAAGVEFIRRPDGMTDAEWETSWESIAVGLATEDDDFE